MMNSNYAARLMEMFPEEFRLIHEAKSGDANAFVKLYDVYVERVYRYIHFLAPTNGIAEGLTFQVFLKAWEQLGHYQVVGSSFIIWLYSIARNQVAAYYRTHKKTVAPDNDFTLAIKGGSFRQEFEAIRDGFRFLTGEQQQVLILKFFVGMPIKDIARAEKMREGDVRTLQFQGLQVFAEHLKKTELQTDLKGFQRILEECLPKLSNGMPGLDECLAHYPEYADQLRPMLEAALLLNIGHGVEPLSTFTAYTHSAVTQYAQTHPRQPQIVIPMFQRTTLTVAMLVAVLLVSGTAHAQSALPGEAFYPWKRASEQAWRALSPNPIATDIMLAERRLAEWIAVSDDPSRSDTAMADYLEVLGRLESTHDVAATVALIVPALQQQQQTLSDANLPTTELDTYLVEVATIVPPTPTEVPSTATQIPPTATEVPPTATEIPPTATEVPPTATEVPPTATEIQPTATEVPPTATEVPPTATEVPPTATEVPPTEVPTDVPTDVPQPTPADQVP